LNPLAERTCFSQARSDLGAATAGKAAVFGGGCSGGSSGGGGLGGGCLKPSAVVDVLRPSEKDTKLAQKLANFSLF
jgi:hypothetical protein